jgi:hypothetical protein
MTTALVVIGLAALGIAALWFWGFVRAIKGIGDSIDTKVIEQKEAVKASDIIAKTKAKYEQEKAVRDGETKEQVYARIKLRLIKSDSVQPGNSSTTTDGK